MKSVRFTRMVLLTCGQLCLAIIFQGTVALLGPCGRRSVSCWALSIRKTLLREMHKWPVDYNSIVGGHWIHCYVYLVVAASGGWYAEHSVVSFLELYASLQNRTCHHGMALWHVRRHFQYEVAICEFWLYCTVYLRNLKLCESYTVV